MRKLKSDGIVFHSDRACHLIDILEDDKARFYDLLDFAMRKHDKCEDGRIVNEGIGAFGKSIIKVVDSINQMNNDPFFGKRPFEPGSTRQSDFFAGQGDLSKAIWLLCSIAPRREYQTFRREWPGKADRLKMVIDRIIMRLHGDVECLYPSKILIRPFAQLRFLLRLHHEWLWESDTDEPPIFKVMAYLANLSIVECHRQMCEYEKELDRRTADGTVGDLVKARCKMPMEKLPKDRAGITEELLLTVKYRKESPVRCLELSSVLLQYACCMMSDYLKEGQSFYSRSQTTMPRQRMSELFDSCSVLRHSLSFITTAFCNAAHFLDSPLEQASAAYGAFVGLLERFEMLNLTPSVMATLRDAELAANDYFRLVAAKQPRFAFAHSETANNLFRDLSTALDGLSTTLRTFEYEQSTSGDPNSTKVEASAMLNELMRIASQNSKKLNALQTGQEVAKRKLDTISKDVKFVKAEQDSPSEADSTKRGPMPKHQAMIDAAINLLKKWAKENPAPNTASAAHQIFVEWEKAEKLGKLKPGNRYTNEKAFKGIVARHWRRI